MGALSVDGRNAQSARRDFLRVSLDSLIGSLSIWQIRFNFVVGVAAALSFEFSIMLDRHSAGYW